MRTLVQITKQLIDLANDLDTETAHVEADKLLIEAVEVLAPYATDTVNEGDSGALIDAYNAVGKWYA